MLETLDVVKNEHVLVARGQLVDGALKGDLVDDRHLERVLRSANRLLGCFTFFSCFLELHIPLSEVHENLVNRQTMEPGSERGVTSKTTDLAIKLYKNVLSKIFCLVGVLEHAQTDRINPAVVPLIDLFEGDHISRRRCLRQFKIA